MVPLVLCLLYILAANISQAAPSLSTEDALCKSDVLPSATKEFSQYMDKSVKPCDNFYQYVCGKSNINVKTVVEARIKAFSTKFHQQKVDSNSDLNDVKNKARLHYQMCMDMEKRRKRGVEPLLEYAKTLTGLDVVKQDFDAKKFEWIKAVATLANAGHVALFGATYDSHNISLYRDPALTAFNKSEIQHILVATGVSADVASQVAEDVVKFGADLENVTTDDKPESLTFQELHSKIPDISWDKYFEIADGHHPTQKIVLLSPSYFYNLHRKLTQATPKTIANYIVLRAFMAVYPTLDGRYNEFIYSVANPSGKKYDPDPESWCLNVASHWINEAVDSAYVREYFGGHNKTEATELVKFLQKALTENNWSDAKAKEEVSKKLGEINFEVGYPDYLLSDDQINEHYKDLKIIPDKYFESQQNAMKHNRVMAHKQFTSKNPRWNKSPLFVNVYHGKNRVTIPAGQLQPPYYHHCYPEAINFGAVGTLIANEVVENLGKASSCPTSKSDGHVPDTTSVRIAYKAYTDWVKAKAPKENLVLSELQDVSDKQLFFLAYAHNWCGTNKPETEQLVKDTLSNLSEFAEVFSCPAGSNMNPEKKCSS